jgi:sulfur-oxidizing protein SoxY
VNTRIRLAGSQRLTVVAELSGERYRILHQDVLVTSAACLDDSL